MRVRLPHPVGSTVSLGLMSGVWVPALPLTGRGSCGPGRTSAAVERALEDLEGHHLTQGPPDGHCTVRLPGASQVNGSRWLEELLATGT